MGQLGCRWGRWLGQLASWWGLRLGQEVVLEVVGPAGLGQLGCRFGSARPQFGLPAGLARLQASQHVESARLQVGLLLCWAARAWRARLQVGLQLGLGGRLDSKLGCMLG